MVQLGTYQENVEDHVDNNDEDIEDDVEEEVKDDAEDNVEDDEDIEDDAKDNDDTKAINNRRSRSGRPWKPNSKVDVPYVEAAMGEAKIAVFGHDVEAVLV